MLGKSKQMLKLREMIRDYGRAPDPVLITGESGVGKERVALLLHRRSLRGAETFLPVNCALFVGNPGLANSALFGHRKGAFTGADRDRNGFFLEANGGTLFLDEIGDLPIEVQSKLLRVLEDQRITPEGADAPNPERLDIRILAATNRDLLHMVREGSFRQDLYHRLSVLHIRIPPLRERPEDIEPILERIQEGLAEEGFKPKLTEEDRRAILDYSWPGNVRELRKLLRRAVIRNVRLRTILEEERAQESGGQAEHASFSLPENPEAIRPLDDLTREYMRAALKAHRGNLTATARSLKVAVNTLKKHLGNS